MNLSRNPAFLLAGMALLATAMASALAEAPPPPPPEGSLGTVDGAQVYTQICQGCHMPDGEGAVGAGSYPSFKDNANLASSHYMAITILGGRRNMPAFAPEHAPGPFFEPAWLTDVQIANVINHVRTHFGNHYDDPITAAEVAALHPDQGTSK